MQAIKIRLGEAKPALILFYLSATGYMAMISVQRYFGIPRDSVSALCFMAIIFGIYTLNRFTDSAEDFANDEGKFLFFQGRPIFLGLALTALATGTVVLLALEKLNWLCLMLLAAGFCYSCRIIPGFMAGRFRLIRVKEVPLVKNLLVSFLWSASVLALPAQFASQAIPKSQGFAALAGGVFLMILNNTLVHDVMDESGDRLAGIATVPTLMGGRATLWMLWCLDAAWIALLASLCLMDRLPAASAVVPALVVAFPAVYTLLYALGGTARTLVDFLSESDLMVLSVGLLVLRPA